MVSFKLDTSGFSSTKKLKSNSILQNILDSIENTLEIMKRCFSWHGGTTEEGNCSYLLPCAAAAGLNGTNKDQIHTVSVDDIARFLVYRMDVTRSQLTANTGIPVCLVREIWQFKVFTGKEVTPFHEEGNSLQFRAGKKETHFNYK